jgi:hypothetical protein
MTVIKNYINKDDMDDIDYRIDYNIIERFENSFFFLVLASAASKY